MRLVGRDDDLRSLRELLDASGTGRGGTAIITGPPGSGKTALLHRAAECAAARDFTVLTATGSRAESTLPLGMLSQLFHSTPPGSYDAGQLAALIAEVTDNKPQLDVQTLHRLFLAVTEPARHHPIALCIDDLQ